MGVIYDVMDALKLPGRRTRIFGAVDVDERSAMVLSEFAREAANRGGPRVPPRFSSN
jgi:hypothetical protein